MKRIVLFAVLSLVIFTGCGKNSIANSQPASSLNLTTATAPFSLIPGAKFFKDIKYDNYSETAFDIFLPASTQPSALLIQIHGGGFKNGDKANSYSSPGFQSDINNYLSGNIAVATLNYRLLEANEKEGVLKSLNNCKRALQFIRYYYKDFNIDKLKVALHGTSAGAGTGLWIGLNNDMAQPTSADPVLRESTRVRAIVANNTQATYNLVSWPAAVFGAYQPALDINSMIEIAGISSLNSLNTPALTAYNSQVDMLSFVSPDDPDIYLSSTGVPYSFPQNKGNMLHHPLHAKAVMDKAISKGVACKAFIPEMNIDNTNGLSDRDFILQILKN